MGATQYYTATSIDGFIADEHNSLDWLFEVPPGDDEVGQRFVAALWPLWSTSKNRACRST